MQTKIIERYFFFGLLVATLIFSFMIFKPFWVVLVLAISFSIVLYPIYEWLTSKALPNWLSSLITLSLFIIILCGPLLGIGAIVFKQSQNVYDKVVYEGSAKPFMDRIENSINRALPDVITFDINKQANDFVYYISSNIANIFKSTISAFFSFLLMLILIFFFLKEGKKCREAIVLISPLGEENDAKLIDRLTQAVDGVIKGSLLIALAQGILMGLGLWIFGIPNAALFGVIAAITSLIPTFGTSLISVPAILFLFSQGDTTHAVGLLIWAVLVVGMIDNFLGPLVVGRRINIPSILILFAVLGGVTVLGPVGVLVGPLAISLLFALISIYKNEFIPKV